jgi:aminoglycoside phosphotransferase family enzyme/predicted kinase
MEQSTAQPALINALMDPKFYDHTVIQCQLIETHISWIILTGDYAYKIKKPVDLGFLDFSTLEKRHFYCQEELRLNRRLAPGIYLDVVAIHGTPDHPSLRADGDAIEYAVKMRQFPQEAQLDRALARGDLQFNTIDALAQMIATFHEKVAVAGKDTDYGEPQQVYQPVLENFSQIRERIHRDADLELLSQLESWSASSYTALMSVLLQRKADGYIRECHGDMHLRNLAWYYGAPLAFDCLEFNPNLRWIDVISEVAFLVMDLQDHHQAQLAQRFLNAYLQHTGDYGGIRLLRFYLVYRAMVRAKVDAIRACQEGISQQQREEAEKDFSGYLQLTKSYIRASIPQLIITRGLSASGKTTETQPLLESLGAIRIRSDVERKRLFGISAEQSAVAKAGEGIYTAAATQQTYARLLELAEIMLDAGYTVIVDAANLKYEQRTIFQQLAAQKQVCYIILEFTAKPETLRRRIMERKHDASDANLEILEQQLLHWQPLAETEHDYAISIDTEAPYDVAALLDRIRSTADGQTPTYPQRSD